MKGFVVTTFTVLFAVSTITSISVIGIAVSGISNIFTGASHSTDAQWVENNLGGVIANKCGEDGKQPASPITANYSHTFNKLDNLSIFTNAGRKRTSLELNYESSSTKAVLTDANTLDFVSGTLCEEVKLNGTRPDASKIPRSDTIEVNTGNALKFRIFETEYSGGIGSANYKNITIQVRQD
jgi:hypothetical protein